MIKKVIFILLFAVSVFAYSVLLNESDYATEIRFDNIKPYFKEITKKNNKIVVFLNSKAKYSQTRDLKSKFVKSIKVGENSIIIEINKDTDYFYRFDNENLLLVFTPRREITDVRLKSIIEKPVIKTQTKKIKNEEAEKSLTEAENFIKNGLYQNAINKLMDIINLHKNDFYAQEAYYKLGMIYYKLGENDPKNYLLAADYLADFASKFPDHYLASDALFYSAMSKEKAGMYYEAIFDYKSVIQSYPNTLNAKKSYFKIVNIYENIGQYDKAINAIKEYSDKFNDKSVEVLAHIGKLYFLLKDINLAKEYFLKIIDKKDDLLKLGSDTLFAIAKTFEEKGDIDYAINIYSKIYNVYPDSKYADMAMFNSALLLEKKGKKKLADSLLLECKEKYKDKVGGEKAAVYYAEKHLKEQPTEYWIDFFSNILESGRDVNVMAHADRLIIESYFYSNRYDEALVRIKEFESKFFDSLELNRVYDIKQKIYLEFAKKFLKESNYAMSESYVNRLLQEFPDSKYYIEASKIKESIALIKLKKMYEKGAFEDTLKAAQTYLIENKKIYFKNQWDNLIEDLYNQLVSKSIDNNKEKAIALSKEYLIYYPNGRYSKDFMENIYNYIVENLIRLVKEGDFIKAIKFYSDNSIWIEKIKNQEDVAILKGYIAFSYFKLGDFETAKKIYSDIKKFDNSIVNLLGILFGEKVTDKNVNKLSKNDLTIIYDELKYSKKADLLKILKYYKKDLKFKYDLLLKIIYSLDTDERYKELKLASNELTSLGMIKDFPNIFVELGFLEFEKKNYSEAIKYLNEAVKFDENKNELPKIYYFLAKSYLQINDKDNAYLYFEKIVKEFSSSYYKKLAEQELKELKWMEKLEKAS
ncbi:tetratricopeptide repeat protein [Deferribacter thermophilus]|uniref:tetratricopeptide repeat protein n=1 Tax=Deferribacter thermophilus TaxID=53573 RepID=UPI003C244F85